MASLPLGLDAQTLFGLAFNTVEIRTALSPPVVIDMNSPTDPSTASLMQLVQPALILNGPAGRMQVAPYGVPDGISPVFSTSATKTAVGVGLGLVGLVLIGASIL